MRKSFLATLVALFLSASGVQATDLYFDNGQLRYSFSANASEKGGMSAGGGLSMSYGTVEYASMQVTPRWFESPDGIWRPSPTKGYLTFGLGGSLGIVRPTQRESQSLEINSPYLGVFLNEYVSTGSYLENPNDNGKGIVALDTDSPNSLLPTKLWSTADGWFSSSSFVLDGDARGYYNEYVSDWDGVYVNRFGAGFSVPIQTTGTVTIPTYGMAYAAVPEPGALGLLALAPLALLVRRRPQLATVHA